MCILQLTRVKQTFWEHLRIVGDVLIRFAPTFHYNLTWRCKHVPTQGCDICLEDSEGRTCVHLAALHDHPQIIQCLLDRGMELDMADREGRTPAHYAAHHGNLESLRLLVKNAVDISIGEFF